ncbi:MAG: aldose 1-epimerase family protein [Kiritimatiellaeota bacterium]|nr:aldose 1-epimerase family protein [Kiritimatiellota bacterium]
MSYIGEKEELRRRIGCMRQVAGIREMVLNDGLARGIRIAEIDNGSGLSFKVLLDRGMDLEETRFKGLPIAWRTPNGPSHPAFAQREGIGWLRTWGAGLLTGCGMLNVGVPASVPDGEETGLHGRVSHLPAENCAVREEWGEDGEYHLSVSGTVRQARLYGENLVLRRTVSTVMGRNVIKIDDEIVNEGFRPSPFMMLYHINIGYPVVSPSSVLSAVEHNVVPRNDVAAAKLDVWNKCSEPDPEAAELCFYHDIPAGDDGMSRCAIRNDELGLEVEVAYRAAELPYFTQWKMMGVGEYVIGLEPANCHVEGQIAEREKFDTLKSLRPGEKVEHSLEISVNEPR